MKTKTFLMLLICTILAFALSGFTFAEVPQHAAHAEQTVVSKTTTQHSHCICGNNTDIGDHTAHSDVVYSPWDGKDFDYTDGDTGVIYLYLTNDVITEANSCNRTDKYGILSITQNQTVYLCLNGHSLKNGLIGNNTIDVCGKLVLCDCAGGGTVGGRKSGANSGAIWVSDGQFDMFGGILTGSYGLKNGGGMYIKGSSAVKMYGGAVKDNVALRQAGGVYVLDTSKFEMFGGVISDNSAPDFGGGVIVDNGSSFIMNGGSIENNFSGNFGGGIFVSGGTFIMNGGTIKGNKAANGGGVCVTFDTVRGNVTLNGGSISGNSAFGNGGGVYIWAKATVNLNGCIISDNNAAYGGGISLYSSNEDRDKINNVLNFGAGEIKNNTAKILGGGICCFQYSVLNFDGNEIISVINNKDTNVFLADKCTFNVGSLIEGSLIGISSIDKIDKGAPKTICTISDENSTDCFFSDSDEYVIKYDSGNIKLTADFFLSLIKYVTGTEQTLPDEIKKGFEESLTFIIPSESPSLPCKTFLGWAETENSAAATYRCGDSVNVVGEKTLYAVWQDESHSFVKIDEVPETCTKDGVKSFYKCNSCGKEFIDGTNGEKTELTDKTQLVIPAGHRFGAWEEAVEATTEKEGTIAHKDCTICGKHFDVDGNEIDDITTAILPVPEPADKGCSGAISTSEIAALTVISSLTIVAIMKKKKKFNR